MKRKRKKSLSKKIKLSLFSTMIPVLASSSCSGNFRLYDTRILPYIIPVHGYFILFFILSLLVLLLISLYRSQNQNTGYRKEILFLDSMLNHFPNPVMTVSPQMKILKVNRSFQILNGLNENPENSFIQDIFPPSEYCFSNIIIQYIKGNQQQSDSLECSITNAAGMVREFNIKIEAFYINKTAPANYMILFTDITLNKRTEEILRNDEERFRAIANYTYNWESWYSPRGELLWMNPAVEKIIGYTPEECSHIKYFPYSLAVPEDRKKTMQNIRKAFRHEEGNLIEVRLIHKDGYIVYTNISWQPIYDSNQIPMGFRISIIDITARKKAEKKLRDSEEQFRLFIRNFPGLLFIKNSDGEILIESRMSQNLFSANGSSLKKKNNFDLFEPKLAAQLMRDEQKALTLADGDYLHTVENVDLPNRKKAYYMTYIFPIFRQTNTDLIGTVMIDITKQIKSEKEYTKSEERYRKLFESVTDYIYTVYIENGTPVRTHHGQGCLAVTGYSTEEFSRDNHLWYAMIHPDDIPHVLNQAEKSLKGIPTQPLEHRIIHKNGSIRWIRNTHVLYKEADGTVSRYDGVISDITERKKAEENLKNSLNEKNVLLKEVHHRVKNNLQIISSLLALQAETIQEDQFRRHFYKSRDRVKSMAMIHESLYNTDQIDQIYFHDYLHKFVNYLFHANRPPNKNIDLMIDASEIPLSINKAISCGLILNEILTNSLNHAYQSLDKGMIEVYFYQENQKNHLIIKDDGIGLPQNISLRKAETLGMQLISSLCIEINATIEISRENGTEYRIDFP